VLDGLKYLVRFGGRESGKKVNDGGAVFENTDQQLGNKRRQTLSNDMIAAVAVAAYSVFFSTPLHMLGWPVAVGMLAHALRWGARLQRRDRRLGRLYRRRADPHASRATLAYAVCGHRLRLRGVDDSGRLPIQDGERPSATCRRLAYDVQAHQRDNRRRHDRHQSRRK
jgi:hypothetical protein